MEAKHRLLHFPAVCFVAQRYRRQLPATLGHSGNMFGIRVPFTSYVLNHNAAASEETNTTAATSINRYRIWVKVQLNGLASLEGRALNEKTSTIIDIREGSGSLGVQLDELL